MASKYAKHTKKTTKRAPMRKKSTYRKATPTSGVAGNNKNFQIINTIKPRIYNFEDCINWATIPGSGTYAAVVDILSIVALGRYGNLITMFRQYKINSLKYRFRCRYLETTDGNFIPTMYIKYNYDPDLLVGALNEAYFLRQSNTVVKQFMTNDNSDSLLEYTVKPAVMGAKQLWGTTAYVPSPMFNQWVDFDPSGTLAEVAHYGVQYFINNVPIGQTIEVQIQMNYSCRDLI